MKCSEVLLHSDKMCVLDASLSRWYLCTPSHNCWLSLFCVRSYDCVRTCPCVCDETQQCVGGELNETSEY